MSRPHEDHLAFFKDNGFVKAGTILTDAELAEVRAAAQREIAAPRGIVQMENGGSGPVVRRVSRLLERDDAFRRVAAHPVVAGYVGALLGYPFEICLNRHNMMLCEAAGRKDRVGWHQDAGDWRCDRIISLTILLDDATAADGCLHVAPGVYRDPELQQPGVRMDLGKAKNQEIIHRAVPIECKAGEGYFFHSLTPHIPGPNHSPHQRKSLHFAYVASRDRDLAAAYTALETITIEAPGRWSGNATRKDDVQ